MDFLNFVSNGFVAGSEGKTFSKYSPFDHTLLGPVVDSGGMDLVGALQGAKKAAASFRNSSLADRAAYLETMALYFTENAPEIAYQEALHQGLSAAFVREVSVDFCSALMKSVAQDLRSFVPLNEVPSAVGVVGIITPWTLSLRLVMERVVPAIAAGNTVIVKTSELSPVTGKILGEAVLASGLPPGVVQIIQGKAPVGELIAGHPGIRAVSAVGRSSTMEAVAKAAVFSLKKVQLGGGAKNSMIVLADADYEKDMIQILCPFLIGQGQMCWNMSRLFIPESSAPAFLEKAKAVLHDLQLLQSPEGAGMWTPLIDSERPEKLEAIANSGVAEHGKIIFGGDTGLNGSFVRPILMLDLPQCSTLQQDEVAGPLILVTPVKYQHEAVKWANTSYLAHSAVVWGSPEKSRKLALQLEASFVWSNSWLNSQTPSIWGHKQSSYGNPDMSWRGGFYSDVKKLAGP